MIKKTLNHIWDTITSLEMAVTLFVFIIIASLFGAFTSRDIYHSYWFVTLLVMFGIDLFLCTVLSIARRRSRIDVLFSHLGILIILVGVIISSTLGERGHLSISEGETINVYKTGMLTKSLPFQIRLNDFIIEWKNDTPHNIGLKLFNAGISRMIAVEPGNTYDIAGTSYSIEISRFVPDLFVGNDMKVVSRSEEPLNPAMLVLIKNGQQTEKRWLFANYPDFTMSNDKNIVLTYKYGKEALDFKSNVTVTDNADIGSLTSTIEVNHPLKYKGYSLYQAHFDPRHPQWTGFEVVHDPGVNVVFAGILFLNIGVLMLLYRKGTRS